MVNAPIRLLLAVSLVAALPVSRAVAQGRVTSPRDALGFDIGDDYRLATYTQLEAYWRTLAKQSSRMVLREIGKTAEGRPQLMAIITSPANLKKLEPLPGHRPAAGPGRGAHRRPGAHALAREGKAVVWIDGGLHATEVLGAQQLMETGLPDAQPGRRGDPAHPRRRASCSSLHANPDGMDLVSDWYMREPDTLKRATSHGMPRLYQKYIGHDNNRDFYMRHAGRRPRT